MTSTRVGCVIVLLATLSIWGCAQNSAKEQSAAADRAAKLTRLQEDVRNLSGQVEKLRVDLAAATRDKEALQQEVAQLRLVVKERDELRDQLQVRTGERDAGVAQLETLRNGLRALMEQADAALTPSSTIGAASATSDAPIVE
jgi:hypothetical protein